ncbi:MAG TPA: hypothetical protein VFN10_20625 [Thermoanaerobaculia bacterium]|nr:hypothetical protein [Thermoanaerobaculia bacterium]
MQSIQRSRSWRPAVALVLCELLLFTGCGTTFLPANAKQTCIDTTGGAPAFATWFESGTVTKNGVVKPADSVNFPDSPNCSFYQWSEQMYLWLTSPSPSRYGGGGRIFNSPAFFDVSAPDASGNRTFIPHQNGVIRDFSIRAAQVGPNHLQLLFDSKGQMREIELPPLSAAGRPLVLDGRGETREVSRIAMSGQLTGQLQPQEQQPAQASRKVVFFDMSGAVIEGVRPIIRSEARRDRVVQKFMVEKVPVFLDILGALVETEQGQAGGNAVLQARNGSLVYYTTVVNDVDAYFLTGTKNGGITPTPTQFPTTQAELDEIVNFAALHSVTFPDPEALAIEAKLSWVENVSLPNPGTYITMNARIPTYDTTDPDHWVQNGTRVANLALVGVHVVGSAAGHAEMIWATFEHENNMPNGDYTYINTSNATVTIPQVNGGNWLFSQNGSAGPFNQEHMSFNAPQIDANTAGGFTISPSDTVRWKAWGAASDVQPNFLSTAASNTEILSINNLVRSMLKSGDPRANMVMTGATWTIGGDAPTGAFPGGNEVGTSRLSNGTMETYQQGVDTTSAQGTNCFSCHVTNDTSVSHVFGPLQPLFGTM